VFTLFHAKPLASLFLTLPLCFVKDLNHGVDSLPRLIRSRTRKLAINIMVGEGEGPVAMDDTVNTTENMEVKIDVLANDVGDKLFVQDIIGLGPSNGAAVIDEDGAGILYTPNEEFCETDSFGYEVIDGQNKTDTATVTVNVICDGSDPSNNAPDAMDDSVSTRVNTEVVIDVLENDTDPDLDELTIKDELVVPPAFGTAEVDAFGSIITYVPNTGFCGGSDSFAYEVSDGKGGTDIARASINVVCEGSNSAPEAMDDSVSTTTNTEVVIDVLANDEDDDGDELTVAQELVQDPANGSAEVDAFGSVVTYVPNNGFCGSDAFGYEILDGRGGTDEARVSIRVDCNSAPMAENDAASTVENTKVDIYVLDNDTDPDLDKLTVQDITGTGPSNGTADINGLGSFITYVPGSGFCGSDSFGYEVSDGRGGTATATVAISMVCEDDERPADECESKSCKDLDSAPKKAAKGEKKKAKTAKNGQKEDDAEDGSKKSKSKAKGSKS